MTEDDIPIIMLMPVVMPNGQPVRRTAGAFTIPANCGHECWLSNAGMQAKLAEGMRSICIVCAVERGLLDPNNIHGVPGALDELIAEFGPEKGRQMYERSRDNLRMIALLTHKPTQN